MSCYVEDCPRPRRSRGAIYCETHYYRLRRTGSVADPDYIRGGCQIDGCASAATCSGKPLGRPAEVYCRKHYLRLKKRGDATFECAKDGHPQWTGDAATNGAVHQRLRKSRGHANRYACVDCDKQAQHWSYDHTDPDERIDPRRGPYSLDPDRYHPRCAKCHKRFDMARLKDARSQ